MISLPVHSLRDIRELEIGLYSGQFTLSTQLIKPNYMYEIEYGSNQWRFKSYRSSCWSVLGREGSSRDEMGMWCDNVKPANLELESWRHCKRHTVQNELCNALVYHTLPTCQHFARFVVRRSVSIWKMSVFHKAGTLTSASTHCHGV